MTLTSAAALLAALLAGQEPESEPPVEEWVAPAEERARPNPVPGGEETLLKGRALFQRNCARCHGAKGDGDGPAGVDLRDPELQARLTDGEIFWKLSTGRRDGTEVVMPAFARTMKAEADRWAVVRFVRSIALPPAE